MPTYLFVLNMKYVKQIKLTHEASNPMAGSMNSMFFSECSPVVPGGAMAAPPDYGRSFNPISTRVGGGQIMPTK